MSHRLDKSLQRFSPEAHQLCESEPFRLWCEHGMPGAPDAKWSGRICAACGNPHHPSSNNAQAPGSQGQPSPPHPRWSPSPGHHRPPLEEHHELLHQLSEPEQLHERLGLPPWEAPYVWETNYL